MKQGGHAGTAPQQNRAEGGGTVAYSSNLRQAKNSTGLGCQLKQSKQKRCRQLTHGR